LVLPRDYLVSVLLPNALSKVKRWHHPPVIKHHAAGRKITVTVKGCHLSKRPIVPWGRITSPLLRHVMDVMLI